MSDLIERLNAATEGTTPGPWWTDGKYSGSEMGCAVIAARTDCGPLPGNPTRGMVAWASAVLNTKARECEANARFIATARQLVPEAADRIEELEAELAEAKRHLEKMLVWSDDLSLQCAEIRPKFREDYNAAAGFLDGDDDNG